MRLHLLAIILIILALGVSATEPHIVMGVDRSQSYLSFKYSVVANGIWDTFNEELLTVNGIRFIDETTQQYPDYNGVTASLPFQTDIIFQLSTMDYSQLVQGHVYSVVYMASEAPVEQHFYMQQYTGGAVTDPASFVCAIPGVGQAENPIPFDRDGNRNDALIPTEKLQAISAWYTANGVDDPNTPRNEITDPFPTPDPDPDPDPDPNVIPGGFWDNITNIWNWITQFWTQMVSKLGWLWETMREYWAQQFGFLHQWFMDLTGSLSTAFTNLFASFWQTMHAFFTDSFSGIVNAFASLNTVFAEVAGWFLDLGTAVHRFFYWLLVPNPNPFRQVIELWKSKVINNPIVALIYGMNNLTIHEVVEEPLYFTMNMLGTTNQIDMWPTLKKVLVLNQGLFRMIEVAFMWVMFYRFLVIKKREITAP